MTDFVSLHNQTDLLFSILWFQPKPFSNELRNLDKLPLPSLTTDSWPACGMLGKPLKIPESNSLLVVSAISRMMLPMSTKNSVTLSC